MTFLGSRRLDAGDVFPDMTLNLAQGGTLRLPADLGTQWGVLLVYRGHF